jgi:pyruvate,water dikinase
MRAFDRIKSGIPDLDKSFDNIRLGDNVVWHVSNLDEFKLFVNPFIKQALKDHRNLIYVRFANHEPFIDITPEEQKILNQRDPEKPESYTMVERENGLKIYQVDPSTQFEAFTVAVHNIITKEGRFSFYVFDSLSELQVAWSADLMMGNFFRVTCPYLFDLDTVAYFPLHRGSHSFETIAKIRDTTQLLIDIYSEDDEIYIHPLKIWNRYSQNMFLGHKYDKTDQSIEVLTDGVGVSRFYQVLNKSSAYHNEQTTDNWDRFFTLAHLQYRNGEDITDKCDRMCKMMLSKDSHMCQLVKENFEPIDYFDVYNRLIGSGMIGGKACGMLIARKIIKNKLPKEYKNLEPHDSFYIGSDMFYTYIVANDLWDLRIKQRTKEGYYVEAAKLKQALKNGEFPEEIRENFKRILDYFGQTPIIVRSSSFLEDGFGNAFAGKYESVFCVNRGTFEERLLDFENAVKTVYASTMDISALEYRNLNNLEDIDEQMALLVQRVSGSYYENYYFPTVAGVGYSYSPYSPLPDMDKGAGMLRLVMGLGTKAVDRTQNDYPRIINLDKPKVVTMTNVADRHRYSQHSLDVLDLNEIAVKEHPVAEGLKVLPRYAKNEVVEHDREVEERYREQGNPREVVFVSCQGMVNNKIFTDMMKNILQTLEDSYDYPVDIEYTVNIGEKHSFVVNLVQCRPLSVSKSNENIKIPKVENNILFHIKDSSMGRSRKEEVNVIVSVDPRKYYEFPYNQKVNIARVIGKINEYYKNKGLKLMLIVPGRIGTSSPELGIPVTFADISDFFAILEVSYSEVGYVPELSFGSHLFQDLVEADIFYGALFENEKRIAFDTEILNQFQNQLPIIDSSLEEEIYDMIEVVEIDNGSMEFYYDMKEDESICFLDK